MLFQGQTLLFNFREGARGADNVAPSGDSVQRDELDVTAAHKLITDLVYKQEVEQFKSLAAFSETVVTIVNRIID